jgi:prolyl 4-hydroxylase
MLKILQNKIIFFAIIIFLIAIISYFSYISIPKIENFGYDSDPKEYIEPKVYPNFITDEEATYILNQSKLKFEDSTVVGGHNFNIRKSKTCWLSKSDNKIKNIIQRVCNIGNYPFKNCEDSQVVKYDPNGYYNEHHDSCCDNNDKCIEFNDRGGNRIVTMVIYLNDGFDGGATRFVNLNKNIKPNKNSGILFYPMNKKGDKCHDNALHAGLPIVSGQKYIANVWIREHDFI